MFPFRNLQHRNKGLLAHHLCNLKQQLLELAHRVREAVAATIGETLAQLMRDVVDSVLLKQRSGPISPSNRHYAVDESDPWVEDLDRQEWSDPADVEAPEDTLPAGETFASRRPVALAAALGAASWWLRRRGSLLTALAVGFLAGTVTLLTT